MSRQKTQSFVGMSKIWSFYTASTRPSVEDLMHFGRCISYAVKNKKNPKILILGATPELRELALKFSLIRNAQITLIDRSLITIKAMDNLMHFVNKNEKKIVADWLDMPFSKKSFDIVIGDIVLEQIEKGKKEFLLQNIHKILKSNGIFIVSIQLILSKFKNLNIRKEFEKCVNLYLNSKLDLKTAVNYMLDIIWRASIFRNEERAIWQRPIYEEVKKFKAKNKLEKLFLDETLNIIRHSIDYKWWPETKKNYEKLFKKYFSIKKVMFSQRHLGESEPIYFLEKKG